MKHFYLTLFTLFAAIVTATAQNADAIKQRMAERLPAITEMKTSQVIGENNEGYLTILKSVSDEQAKLVQEENLDRNAVYTMLAKQLGAPIDLVEKKRAQQLFEQAVPGTMVQNQAGEWIVKS